ncbi:MAG: translation elongation factor 4 [Planctomycetota bacterium]
MASDTTHNIRNFCIIAHVDHGKSTLADRLLLKTGAIEERRFRDQVLDAMDIERERGITIKAKSVLMRHTAGGTDYILNLIDTPGHVDFSYEVSRSLAACEGALLVVDASQGVEAQTVANAFLAMEHNLVLIPVINKIDLPNARPDVAIAEMGSVLGIEGTDAILASAKEGKGVDEILAAIVARIPAPTGDSSAPLKALIFDSHFDDYQGVIAYVRVFEGTIMPGRKILMMQTRHEYEVEEVGVFLPGRKAVGHLSAGDVGYLTGHIRSLRDIRIGDTVTERDRPTAAPLAGYRAPVPMVFCGFYPGEETSFENLRGALEKLQLNDSSFTFQPETSALGFGFRCGFLGLLHMEIIQERLERESGVRIIKTAPNVTYEVVLQDGAVQMIDAPSKFPPEQDVRELREPYVRAELIVPSRSIGDLHKLCDERRGVYVKTEFISPERVLLIFELPLAEIVYDFYDKLKSITSGYGTMDYTLIGYRPGDIVKLDILVADKPVDALSVIVPRHQADRRGRAIIRKLRKEIPRHLFEIALQAAIGKRVVARETISAMSKNVTAKCYGGDISRKRKLWDKQKEGKKRMKRIGQVDVPQEAFLAVLETEE